MTEAVKHETVLDTGAEQLGKTYAHALIGAAKNAGVAEQVIEQLGRLVDEYLDVSPQLTAAFASPRVDDDEKTRVIDKIFADEFHPILIKFLKIMSRRGRLAYIRAVRDAAEDIHDELLGRVLASVRTAVPLDDCAAGPDHAATRGSHEQTGTTPRDSRSGSDRRHLDSRR